MELYQRKIVEKGSSAAGAGHRTGSPGQWSQPQASRIQEAFGRYSQT